MKINNQMNSTIVLIFIYSITCFFSVRSQELSLDCHFIEASTIGPQQREALLSGSCKSCECIQQSFIQGNLTELESKYRSEMAESLRIRFAQQKIPEFMDQMKEFDTVDASCGLDRLQELSCEIEDEFKNKVEGMFLQYFNQQDTTGCFPAGAVNRATKYRDHNSSLVMLKAMLEKGVNISKNMRILSDPLFKIYQENFPEFKDIKPTYKKIKEAILNDSELKSALSDTMQDKCNSFFEQMDAVFCQGPKKLPVDKKIYEDLFAVDSTGAFPEKASLRELEVFTLQCQADTCKSQVSNKTSFCSKRKKRKGYVLSSLLDKDPSLLKKDSLVDNTENKASSYQNYCPLLRCKSFNKAYEVMDGITNQCKERTPQWELLDLVEHCKSENAELICQEEMLVELIKNYNPEKDRPLPPPEKLLAGRSYEKMSTKEKRKILKSYGYTGQALDFLGELGLKHAFGEGVELSGQALGPKKEAFRELGRETARNREEMRRESIVKERQKEEKTKGQNKKNRSFSERFARSSSLRNYRPKSSGPQRSSGLPETQHTAHSVASKQRKVEQPAIEQSNASYKPQSAKVMADEDDTNRLSEQKARTSHEYRELETEIKNLRKQAQQIKSDRERQAYEDEITGLKNEISKLNSGERSVSRRPKQTEYDDQIGETQRNKEFRDQEAIASQALSGSFAQQDKRSLSSTQKPKESEQMTREKTSRYLERSSAELALLSIEDLDDVTPGEEFVLGVREAEKLKKIEMHPEKSGEMFYYRPSFVEKLSVEAKSSLLQSPFFQEYVHPDVKKEFLKSIEESLRHKDLVDILSRSHSL